MIPLGWSDLIQETEQCRQRTGGKVLVKKKRVLNRHQRLDMPFSQRMNILQLPFCLFSSPWNQYSHQHKQAINQPGFSCQYEGCATHSFARTVIPVCMSEIQRGTYGHMVLNEILAEHLKGRGFVYFPYHWKRSQEESNQCMDYSVCPGMSHYGTNMSALMLHGGEFHFKQKSIGCSTSREKDKYMFWQRKKEKVYLYSPRSIYY